ncbi:hypothetical protein G4984_11935 [[Ruminococcus] gnavus]|uniref:hypothetical protein n=1 Tax=Mediterraneibacter gnavus TaxID=33038 RepID=UPI00156EEBB5|nr:hypothetical protein [Mediterraneibacter gnavus]NSI01753.1 hypothetical protein [Mediterraneibacter gnavus]
MSDYLLQMIEVQASVITDLTEVNKRLLLELEQYRAVIRQIKRCRFHQIKTGLSEHLTMG